MTHRRSALAWSLVFLPALVPAQAALSAQAAPHHASTAARTVHAMGTTLCVHVAGAPAAARSDVIATTEAVVRAFEEVERRLSTWREDSELARLNRSPAGSRFALSPELAADLAEAEIWRRATGGAFDPGVGALVDAWDLRGVGRVPPRSEIEALRQGATLAQLARRDGVAIRTHASLRLEEGGFAKGRALDLAIARVRELGAAGTTIDIGGQVAFYGNDDATFAVAHPDDRECLVARVRIDGGSLATTGNSERHIVVGGERYGHVIDPWTGRPAVDFGSVTVWAQSATAADCLSTGLFVLGPRAALAWASRHPGIEALVIERAPGAPGGVRLHATAGLAGRVDAAGGATVAFVQDDARAQGQSDLEKRVDALERDNRALRHENTEIKQRIGAIGEQLERVELGRVITPLGEGKYGLGPGASKVYDVDQGLSIGGYGEFHYQQRSGTLDVFDALRAVLYFGYKFDERWVFNSEIEFEHGTTSASSGTTTSGGSASLEFGQVDYLHCDEINARAGLMLVPVGLVNEMHEPTTFLPSNRSFTEQMIIPTTWRELGAGIFGDVGGFSYRAYVLNGLEGSRFSSSGLRGGRQNGNRAAVDDVAGVVRVDWTDTPGLLVGGSVYYGKAGQDNASPAGPVPDLATLILEGHAEFRSGPLVLRGLIASAQIDDAGTFNTSTGANLASGMLGYYLEAGFDVLAQLAPGSGQSLTPFVRFEQIDTQYRMPAGFIADPTKDDTILTFGANWKPIDQLVLKVDYYDRDHGNDVFSVLLGYVF